MNERKTETIVEDFYRGENVEIIPQPILKGASKNITGNDGRPEFLIKFKEDSDTVVVVECKKAAYLIKAAITEATHYASFVQKEYKNVIAVAVAGQQEDYKAVTTVNGEIFNSMLTYDEIMEVVNKEDIKIKKVKITETITTYAINTHNFMRDNLALSEAKKPLVISAIMIALMRKSFANSFEEYEKEGGKELVKQLLNSIKPSLHESGMPANKVDEVISEMVFMGTMPQFQEAYVNGKYAATKTHTKLYHLVNGVNDVIMNREDLTGDNDVLGKFYGEFIKYTGGDGSGLGIVLTPHHVANLMCDLVDIKVDDILYDPCTGTGGFLIAGMHKMFNMATTDEQIENIRKHQLLGVELQPTLFSMAAANMLLNGDGKANLTLSSCFAVEVAKTYDYPTKCIMNPPYAQKEKGLAELDFIIHGCNTVKKGALVAAIVPKSVFIDKKNKRLKEKLMENNTVKAVISMPDQLFTPTATNTAIIVIEAGTPHNMTIDTFLYDFSDDGYKFVAKQGRVHVDFKEKSDELLLAYNNKRKTPKSALSQLTPDDEWVVEAYMDTDYTLLDEDMFIGRVAAFNAHSYLQNPLEISSPKLSIPTTQLDTSTWEEFNYVDIFHIEGGNDYSSTRANDNTGANNFIGSSEFNNGVTCTTSLPTTKLAGTITVAKDGSVGSAFYQTKPYSVNGHVTVLTVKERSINSNIGNFLTTIIELEKKKYSFGRAWGQARMRKSTIKLPITATGNIDWDFMENYMKEIYI